MRNTEVGLLQPQAVEFEESVLGAIMLEASMIPVVADILRVESFYVLANQKVYSAIMDLYKSSYPVDIQTVVQQLKKSKDLESVGGAYYVSKLAGGVGSSSNSEYQSRIIQQKFIQRELIRISTATIKESYDEGADVFDLLENLEKNLTAINKDVHVGKIQAISSLWNEVMRKNEILLQKKGISGVPSGYMNIDRITAGWQSPDLIIIAARPAMGKTSLACNFARNAAVDFKIPGAIFSLEMSASQIATRIFSLESNTLISDFTRKGIEADRLTIIEKDCSRLINSPLWIDDTAGISISELKSKARKLKREKNIKWIVVDYLQLMSGDRHSRNTNQNREQEVAVISRGLKALAKELEIPVIALSQLSRAVESRGGDKRPQLSDLRESGAIEQDADIVIFIHRPEYYNITEYEGGESTRGVAEMIFAKHRNGPTGTEKLKFIDYLTKFLPIEDEVFATPSKAMQLPASEEDFYNQH